MVATVTLQISLWRVPGSRGRHRLATVGASAGSFGQEAPDPYAVLGVSSSADYNSVKRAYNAKLRELETSGGSEGDKSSVEKAYNSIVLAQLSDRKRSLGKSENRDEARYADNYPGRLPRWMPSFEADTGENILINTALLGAFAGWAMVSTSAELQPMAFAMGIAFVRLFMKMGSLGRVPTKANSEEAKRQNLMRFIRAFSFSISCVFIAIIAFTLLPSLIAGLFNFGIPLRFLLEQEFFINMTAIGLLWVLTCFFV